LASGIRSERQARQLIVNLHKEKVINDLIEPGTKYIVILKNLPVKDGQFNKMNRTSLPNKEADKNIL
jgi:hypothetical protein